jgi:AcrR family transcriptional regulator
MTKRVTHPATTYCREHGTTVEEVASKHGISRQNLYNWYTSRPEVFRSLVKGVK